MRKAPVAGRLRYNISWGSVARARRRTTRRATRRRTCRSGSRHRSRTCCAVALVVDAPRGRRARALLTRRGGATGGGAAVTRRVLATVGVLARVRIGADGLFALLHDRVVV